MAGKPRIMMISTHGYVGATPQLGKPDTGGQVVYVLELSRCLGRLGYHVDILTRQFEGQPAEERLSNRVRVLRFSCGGDKFIPKEILCEHMPEWVGHVMRFVRDGDVDYSYINSHYWDAGLAGQLLATQLDIPHVHTPHSIGSWKRDNMDGQAADLERKYNFTQRIREENNIYEACDTLLATTPQQRDILRADEYGVPKEKIAVVPPGFDDSRFFPISQASRDALKLEFGLKGRVVLALGRMAHNKGYDLLIQAMPHVLKRVSDTTLLLAIGSTQPTAREEEQIAELKALVDELGISEHVKFADHISDAELPDYYRVADVFALSSRYEPFGMTAVEAMACGTPTIVTTEGGLWEEIVWGLEAVYANPFDTEAYGHAMAAVLTHDRVSKQLSKYGSQKARARFTWMGIAQQFIIMLQGMGAATNESSAKRDVEVGLKWNEAWLSVT